LVSQPIAIFTLFDHNFVELGLRQFESQGLTINEGIVIDARLVKSANPPISNDKIKKARDKHKTADGKLDKNGNPLKFHLYSLSKLCNISWRSNYDQSKRQYLAHNEA
jgi:hypothetical protein